MSDAANKIKPLDDRVVLRGLSEIDTSVSGLEIPATAGKERPQRAEVVAIGPGKLNDDGTRAPIEVKVGDVVLFSKYAPDEIVIDGEDFFIARADQLLAVIK